MWAMSSPADPADARTARRFSKYPTQGGLTKLPISLNQTHTQFRAELRNSSLFPHHRRDPVERSGLIARTPGRKISGPNMTTA